MQSGLVVIAGSVFKLVALKFDQAGHMAGLTGQSPGGNVSHDNYHFNCRAGDRCAPLGETGRNLGVRGLSKRMCTIS